MQNQGAGFFIDIHREHYGSLSGFTIVTAISAQVYSVFTNENVTPKVQLRVWDSNRQAFARRQEDEPLGSYSTTE